MDQLNQVAIQVSNLATVAAAHSLSLLENFLVLVVLTVVFILFSYRSGRGGILALTLSLYIGYAVYLVFPYTNMVVSAGGSPLMKALISVAIYAISCIVPYIFIERILGGGFGVISVLPRFALSFLGATFLIALAYHVFHVSNIYTFPEPMNTFFAPDQYFFWWFVAPLIGLLVLVH